MLTATTQGIQYNPEFFDEAFVRLIAAPEDVLAVPETPPEDLIPPETPADPEAVFDEVWARIRAKPEFAGRVAELDELRPQARARALGPVALPPGTDAELTAALEVPYAVIATPDGFSHVLGGVEVLHIPATLGNASKANARARMIISAAKVAVDMLMIVACACGVQAALLQRAAARAVASTAASQGPALVAASAKMVQAAQAADKVKKMHAVLAVIYKGLDLWKLAWAIVAEMSFLEQALAVATVLVNLGLAFVSGGAAIWLRIAGLGFAITAFINDLIKLVNDFKAWRAA